ncbi:PP2A regulatory subunit TAP46 [Hibiscus syriacus]|uniref:PP2A regulatory subunit TAP46 n=1 Tax=Hibiscus syriacus TaxID=106335 RepID=A0A6A3APK3_HIBSY|nr:PP2A regulatory subunit TAP46 [Hibiscus syriacus]
MGEFKVEDTSLAALFDQALKIHLTSTESGADQNLVKKGCKVLAKCEDMVNKLGLFSSNETNDDIGTTNLKYILVPFYLAELNEKLEGDERIQILKISQVKLKEFISFCEAMELVPQDELEASAQGASNSFADRRVLKIARFTRQRAAEAKLTEIRERKERRGRSQKLLPYPLLLRLVRMISWITMGRRKERLGLLLSRWLFVRKGKKNFLTVLDDRTKKAEAWHRDAASRARYTQPAAPITRATFAQDVIEGRENVSQAHDHKHQPMIFGPQSLIGGSLTSERERMAAQVFQPAHRMPTMSIEEAGLWEMEMMNKWQERNVKMFEEANSAWNKDKPKMGPSEDDEDDDAAQDKATAWDDWKDDNPRGAGNKKLTPCG